MLPKLLSYFVASVWLINGLYAKILNQIPRHQEIVGRILGEAYARELTIAIGVGEILIGLAILLRFEVKRIIYFQIFMVLVMNMMEQYLVPDLLLWGRLNFLFAVGFCVMVYYSEKDNS